MAAKRPRPVDEARFYASWKLCAALGQCDASDLEDFRRVYRQWQDARRPARMIAFIKGRANTPSRRKP
jgi:hypothetical protein